MPTAANTVAPPDAAAAALDSKALPPALQKLLNRVSEISSLPEITARIVQVVEDPRATAQDMHEIVRNDPALATKILKVVNSAFYGLPAQIASLDRAIIMLGLSAVKNIALASSLARLFKNDAMSDHFAARDLWRHCIGVGVCARMLARSARSAQADEYFVAGLVHDLGLLLAGQFFPAQFREVAERCFQQPQDYCAVERELLQADHQMFGVALAAKWKFPPALRFAIAYHHDPGPLKPEFRVIATMIYLADTLCGQSKHGYYLTSQAQQIQPGMLPLTGLTEAAVAQVIKEMPDQIAEAEQILADA